MDSVAFVQQVSKLNKGKTYLVYCKSGRRSAKAANILEQQNFRHIWNMEGGITAWKGTIKN
jgi:phage shock protein E